MISMQNRTDFLRISGEQKKREKSEVSGKRELRADPPLARNSRFALASLSQYAKNYACSAR